MPAIIMNRVELSGILDEDPTTISRPENNHAPLVRAPIKQFWYYFSAGKQTQHEQRITCVFVGEAATAALQYKKKDNIYVMGQLIRRSTMKGNAQAPTSTTYEIQVIETYRIARDLANTDEEGTPSSQDRIRTGIKTQAAPPFLREDYHDNWPI